MFVLTYTSRAQHNAEHHECIHWNEATNLVLIVGIRPHAGTSGNSRHSRTTCTPASNLALYKNNLGSQYKKIMLMLAP